jgi:hypothetical protein
MDPQGLPRGDRKEVIPMLWWILQIVGAFGVVVAQTCNRYYGVGLRSWIIYSLIAIFITYPSFGKSFAIAPTFFSAWFIGQTALNIVGLLTAFIIFKDVVSITQWMGLVLSLIGGYLIIK